jgi:phenylalanyl-tRNA synthetase beta subunit
MRKDLVYRWSFGGKIQVFQSILLIFLESAYFNPVSIRKTAKDTN